MILVGAAEEEDMRATGKCGEEGWQDQRGGTGDEVVLEGW